MRKISDYLKEERQRKDLSLEDVEKETKIRKDVLRKIENAEFKELPSESYAIGFVKTYAEFLGIPQAKAVAMYRRENEAETINVVPSYQKNQTKFQKKFINIKFLIISIVSISVLVFIAFQYSSFFFGPPLTIETPQNNQVISGNSVVISGKTNPYATILIDGEETRVEIDGTFEKTIFVFTGEKDITVIARNRFGKETAEEITVKIQE